MHTGILSSNVWVGVVGIVGIGAGWCGPSIGSSFISSILLYSSQFSMYTFIFLLARFFINSFQAYVNLCISSLPLAC